MKIAISTTGSSLDDPVDQRFGRCPAFLLVDTDTTETEALDNRNAQARGGAGIQAAQQLAQAGVEAVITGNIGPNAFQTLQAADIDIYTGASGTAGDALQRYKNGELETADGASVGSHFGMGGGRR
ncbi:MAG: NifB/NifX family molybdenum-iron cluster-binding protein [Thermoplasmatota archaeon]